MNNLEKMNQIEKNFEKDLNSVTDLDGLDSLYLKYFSKKTGLTTNLLKLLPALSPEEKREFGPKLNEMHSAQKASISEARVKLQKQALEDPTLDLTLPMSPKQAGMLHPTTQVIREMNEFFRYYGYSIPEGPEIETAEYNFRKLNLPEGHPATDLQDTLFITEPDVMLRTHTSSVEARVLTNYKPPIRVAFPGKCYRNESVNLTNSAFFYQYQGVVVDEGITIKNLMSTLEAFHKYLFGNEVEIRFRYKYYPEVSPGLGTDIKCLFCHGNGCDVCKHRGWIEVLGSGMIHYNTLKMCGINPEVYTGFAFGMGLDRLVMQKFGITDIRKLYSGGMIYE